MCQERPIDRPVPQLKRRRRRETPTSRATTANARDKRGGNKERATQHRLKGIHPCRQQRGHLSLGSISIIIRTIERGKNKTVSLTNLSLASRLNEEAPLHPTRLSRRRWIILFLSTIAIIAPPSLQLDLILEESTTRRLHSFQNNAPHVEKSLLRGLR